MTDPSIGRVAADLMEKVDDEGIVIAVAMVVIYRDEEGECFARVASSHEHKFEMLGLFEEAAEVVKYGTDGD